MAVEEKSKKKNRLRYMILSVIIAIIAWALVTNITDPDITKTFAGIRVELAGEDALRDNGYVITNSNDLPKLSVKMRGKRSDLIKALDRAKVVLDVSELDEEGEAYIETVVKLPTSRITVERISEQSVAVNVAKIKSRDIPVRVAQTGELGGKLVKSAPVTENVTIKGAASELDLIDAAEVTVDISALSQTGDIELSYVLIIKDGIDRDELHTLIIPENLVRVNNVIYDERELKVEVKAKSENEFRLVGKDTKVEPETVKVGALGDDAPSALTVTIDENASEGEYKLDKQDNVYIPSDRRNVYVKPVWEK